MVWAIFFTVRNTNLGNKLSKYYSGSFENNPPSGLSINEWDAGWILAKAYNDNAVEFKSHWFDGLMMRKRNNGTWSAYEKVLTNSDLNKNSAFRMATGSVLAGSDYHQIRLQVETSPQGTRVLAVYDNNTNALIGYMYFAK